MSNVAIMGSVTATKAVVTVKQDTGRVTDKGTWAHAKIADTDKSSSIWMNQGVLALGYSRALS